GGGGVPGEVVTGPEDRGGHGRRRRLRVGGGGGGDSGREGGRERVDGVRIELPEELCGHRRAAAAAGRPRQPADRARGPHLEPEPNAHRGERTGRNEDVCSRLLAESVGRSKLLAQMARPRSKKGSKPRIDEAELAALRAG